MADFRQRFGRDVTEMSDAELDALEAQLLAQPQQRGGGFNLGGALGGLSRALALQPLQDKTTTSPLTRLAYAEYLRRTRPEKDEKEPKPTYRTVGKDVYKITDEGTEKIIEGPPPEPKEITPTGLIGLYKILQREPERTGGLFGLGWGPESKKEYTPEQQILRDYALDTLEKRGFGPQVPTTEGALPPGVTEEDIQLTMKNHGLTREEVLERIK